MPRTIKRSTAKLSTTVLLIATLILLSAPAAAAFDNSNKDKAISEEARINEKAESTPAAAAPQSLNVSYALYGDAIKLETVAATAEPSAPAATPKPPAVSTAPMTAGEKFHYWINKTILSPGAYGQSIASGMFAELFDNDDNKEDTLGNYFADSMTRAARSMAFKINAGFFEKFAYATIFKQDPRYHRSDKRSAGGKIGYAVSRVFITQGDRCGCDQFNISFLAGGLTASFIANQYVRDEQSSTSHAFRRWGSHIAITALSNILKEFIGGQ
jgi:hypothetical protein